MKQYTFLTLVIIILISLFSCKMDKDKLMCACYVFSYDMIESNYFIEIGNAGTIRTSNGMRRYGYGEALDKEFISREELPMSRDSLLSNETFPDSVWDGDRGSWLFNGYTHMEEKTGLVSDEDLTELKKLLCKLPKKPSRSILCDLTGKDVRHKAGVVIMVGEKNYILLHDDTTSVYYPVYKHLMKISPIPINPEFNSDDCLEADPDKVFVREIGKVEKWDFQ